MKKGLYASLLCALLLSVLLVGCVRLTMDPSPQELMGFREDVLAAYDEAARLYDWFDLAPMPLDESDSVREGENTYPCLLRGAKAALRRAGGAGEVLCRMEETGGGVQPGVHSAERLAQGIQ